MDTKMERDIVQRNLSNNIWGRYNPKTGNRERISIVISLSGMRDPRYFKLNGLPRKSIKIGSKTLYKEQ